MGYFWPSARRKRLAAKMIGRRRYCARSALCRSSVNWVKKACSIFASFCVPQRVSLESFRRRENEGPGFLGAESLQTCLRGGGGVQNGDFSRDFQGILRLAAWCRRGLRRGRRYSGRRLTLPPGVRTLGRTRESDPGVYAVTVSLGYQRPKCAPPSKYRVSTVTVAVSIRYMTASVICGNC
jgi:hypothetical protein